MTEPQDPTITSDSAPEEPELTSVQKFFNNLFGAKGLDVMSKFQGKVREQGELRIPRVNAHPTKKGSGRRHFSGRNKGSRSTSGFEGRLTRHTGACEPVEISEKRKALYLNASQR